MFSLSFIEILLILLVHWWADFVQQSHNIATTKWASMTSLLLHTTNYAAWWFLTWIVILISVPKLNLLYWLHILPFVPITFGLHTLTDYYTSKLSHRYFKDEDYHNGFVVVGIDQVLHYVQLFLTYMLLKSFYVWTNS